MIGYPLFEGIGLDDRGDETQVCLENDFGGGNYRHLSLEQV